MDQGDLPPLPVPGGTVSDLATPFWRRDKRLLIVAGVALALLLALTIAAATWARCGWGGCPSVERLRAYQPGKASRLLDRTGRVFADLRPVEGETIPLRRIPKHVRDAFLAVEDQRFYDHGGVDWRRAFGATVANVRGGGYEQGFSTITMQLARNVFPDRIRARERTLARKILEVRVAYDIEDEFRKDEILELYLSHIYFGSGARGIEAAARHYFGAPADRLSLSQAALLAGLIRGPSHYDPRRHPDRARERRDLVLRLMERQGRVKAEAAAAARAAPLGVIRRQGPRGAEPGLAAYFVEEVRRQLEERLGERLYDETLEVATTLDMDLQRAAEEELERQLRAVEAGRLGRFAAPRHSPGSPPSENGTPYLQGAVVALEVGSGDVLAWVGGRDFRQSRFDRVKSSRRQVGSAFKPFVYAAALREGHYLSERIRDEPIQVRLSRDRVWQPKNFDQEYDGVVTLRDALVRSKNIPTVQLGHDVGLDEIAEMAREAGIRSEIDQTPAMPLGTVAVSPLELAAAYASFAGLGEVAPPRLVLRIRSEGGKEIWRADAPERARVMDAGLAFLITNVLQEALERGTGTAVRASGFDAVAAGKTGTTNDATDAWFVGYTPSVVAAVWMGFDEPRPIMALATGGRLAAPVWGRMMVRARSGTPGPAAWSAPSNVVRAWVDPETGVPLAEGCRPFSQVAFRELFLRGSMPDSACPDRGEVIQADLYPAPSDEDEARGFDLWPEDERAGSEPAPPPEYEEAERPRRRAEEWRRARRERDEPQRREWEKEEKERRKEAEKAWREARKEMERRRREWEREQEKRRRDREKRDERRRER